MATVQMTQVVAMTDWTGREGGGGGLSSNFVLTSLILIITSIFSLDFYNLLPADRFCESTCGCAHSKRIVKLFSFYF